MWKRRKKVSEPESLPLYLALSQPCEQGPVLERVVNIGCGCGTNMVTLVMGLADGCDGAVSKPHSFEVRGRRISRAYLLLSLLTQPCPTCGEKNWTAETDGGVYRSGETIMDPCLETVA